MTKNIIFKGRMGELFGEVHRLNVKTIQEAVHAIDTMQGGLKRYLVDCTENGVDFTVQRGEDFIGYEELGLELGKDDIIISPIPRGSKKFKEYLKIIVGIALIIGSFFIDTSGTTGQAIASIMFNVGMQLALNGIIALTTDEPDELDEEKAQMFNGPINNTKSGIPVPLCYGEIEVGGAVVNFGFTDRRLVSHQGYEFVSKGTNSRSGTLPGGAAGGNFATDVSGNVDWGIVEAEE
jgi:predicted phage tail protein